MNASCNGNVSGISDQYKNIPLNRGDQGLFPKDLNSNERDTILSLINNSGHGNNVTNYGYNNSLKDKDFLILDDPNASRYNDSLINGPSLGSLTSNNLKDQFTEYDIFSNGNGITNISDSDLDKLDFDFKRYSCFEPTFYISNYIINYDKTKYPILTETKSSNIKSLHYDILLPIFKYYFGNSKEALATCRMRINAGLMQVPTAIKFLSGTKTSLHANGQAADFSVVGIDPFIIFDDIKSKKININFGVISVTNGIHITLPYTYEGYLVKDVFIDTRSNNLEGFNLYFN